MRLHFIQQLTPYPGREFSREVTTYVIPDLRVPDRERHPGYLPERRSDAGAVA